MLLFGFSLLMFYVCTLFVNECCLFECPQRPVNGIGSPEAKVVGSCKLLILTQSSYSLLSSIDFCFLMTVLIFFIF